MQLPSRVRSHCIVTHPRLLAALVLAGTAACSRMATEPAAFTLTTQRAQYAAGDAAIVTVKNNSDRDLELGACEPYAIDARTGDAWTEIYRSPTSGFCITLAIELPKNGTAAVTVRLPSTLPPATYRARIARFEPATSNAFVIR